MVRSLPIWIAGVAVASSLLSITSITAWPQTSTSAAARPSAPASAKKSPLSPYAGTWTATLDGKPFITVRLTLTGVQLNGFVEHPHSIDLYDNGEVKSISDEHSSGVVQDAKLTGDDLLLTVKNETTHELDRFSMRLTSDTTANLKMLAMSMPPGMPKPKPWKLTKAEAVAPDKP